MALNNMAPTYISELLTEHRPSRALRSSSQHLLSHAPNSSRTIFYGDRSFAESSVTVWNTLPANIQSIASLNLFNPSFCNRCLENSVHVRDYSDFSIFLLLLFVLSGCLCLLVGRSVCRRSAGLFGRAFRIVCLFAWLLGGLSVCQVMCSSHVCILYLLSVLVKFNIFLPF